MTRNMIGYRRGSLVVIALFDHHTKNIYRNRDGKNKGLSKKTNWIMACSCGRLRIESTKALSNPNSEIRCEECFGKTS